MVNEFKEFINKGNVVTAAVAFVMGLTFKPVIDAVVDRVVMPIIGLIVGQPNFDTLGTFACEDIPADGAAEGLIVSAGQMCAGSIGAVLTVIINFLLVALVLFFIVRAYNRMEKKQEEAPAEDPGPSEIDLLTEIRDSLAK